MADMEATMDSGDNDDSWVPPPVWRLLLVQFVYIFAIFMTSPVFPFIWTNSIADGDSVKGGTLNATGVFLNALAEFLSASLLGVLSDRYGRKPFLMLGAGGQCIDFLVAGLAARDVDYMVTLKRGELWIYSARLIAGFMGNVAIFTKSYIADVSTKKTSALNFSLLAACVGVAALTAPLLGSLLSKKSLRLPMLVASGLNLGILVFVKCCLQESLREKLRVPVDWRNANPVGVLKFLLSSRFLLFFGCMAFLDQFSLSVVTTHIVSYSEAVYNVGRTSAGSMLMIFGVCQLAGYILVLQPVVRHCGEVNATRVGYTSTCLAFLFLALASYTRSFTVNLCVIGILALGNIANPAQLSVGSRCVDQRQQGKLQAALGSLDVIGKMGASGMVTLTWKRAMSAGQPEIIWWLASAIILPGVYISCVLQKYLPPHYHDADTATEKDGSESDDSTTEDGSAASEQDSEQEDDSVRVPTAEV